MKSKLFVLIFAGLLSLSSLTVAVATPCACGREIVPPTPAPVTQGGFAFASFGNGAFFSWNTYVPPVIKLTQNGTSTIIATTAGYFTNDGTGQVAGVSKFKFNKDLYTWTSKNKISPDVAELQKVLVAEELLGQNAQTGVYDEVTKSAVAAFQKKHGIKPASKYPYGYFGPITRAFLNAK